MKNLRNHNRTRVGSGWQRVTVVSGGLTALRLLMLAPIGALSAFDLDAFRPRRPG
jgi:hypothetical protein